MTDGRPKPMTTADQLLELERIIGHHDQIGRELRRLYDQVQAGERIHDLRPYDVPLEPPEVVIERYGVASSVDTTDTPEWARKYGPAS